VGAKDMTDAANQKRSPTTRRSRAVKTGFKDPSGAVKMQPFADKRRMMKSRPW